jgi:hypothetical protein
MFDIYCNICQEHGALVPATMEFCVQRADDPEATHYVRCCDRHKEQGKIMAEIMQHHLAPAIMSSTSLHDRVQRETSA